MAVKGPLLICNPGITSLPLTLLWAHSIGSPGHPQPGLDSECQDPRFNGLSQYTGTGKKGNWLHSQVHPDKVDDFVKSRQGRRHSKKLFRRAPKHHSLLPHPLMLTIFPAI
jgi:hypothetical protein